ncbi:hypothetical protein KVE55_04260 [Helicobacter pylori]|nr:hypothetical protein KVE55_04260 [Helicobacter pylori]
MKLRERLKLAFLKDFSVIDDSLKNIISRMFKNPCDGFFILVKIAETIDDYPLVFKFKSGNDAWEFIVKDKRDENKTMNGFLIELGQDSYFSLKDQIDRARLCLGSVRKHREKVSMQAMEIVEYLIVELLRCGAFDY